MFEAEMLETWSRA